MKRILAILLLTLVIIVPLFASCNRVSQDDYDALLEERDALLADKKASKPKSTPKPSDSGSNAPVGTKPPKLGSTPEPTPAPTPEPTPTPKPAATATPKPTVKPSGGSKSAKDVTYYWFEDIDYGYACPYPNDFYSVNDYYDEYYFSCSYTDGTASLLFAAGAVGDLTPAEDMQDTIDSYGGKVMYKASGDTWYSITIALEDDTIYYAKCFIKNQQLGAFVMIYPGTEKDPYGYYFDVYNYMENGFTFNGEYGY